MHPEEQDAVTLILQLEELLGRISTQDEEIKRDMSHFLADLRIGFFILCNKVDEEKCKA